MADWYYSKNGQQLGPIDWPDLKQLADSGQLLPDDLVWQEGMAQWAKASQQQGLFGAATAPPPLMPPSVGAPIASPNYGAAPGARAQGMPAGYPAAQPFGQPNVRPVDGNSGMAIASLVCGLLFCVPLCSLLAVIFGIIGIRQTGPGKRSGQGMAISGLVLGIVGLLIGPLMIAILLPSLNRARETANRVKCASNERQIGQAILLYSNDHGGQYPPDLATLLSTEQIAPSVFICPDSSDTPASSANDLLSGGHCSYIYLGQGLTQGADPSTVVLYERRDAHGGDGVNMLFADGHIEFMPKSSPLFQSTVKN